MYWSASFPNQFFVLPLTRAKTQPFLPHDELDGVYPHAAGEAVEHALVQVDRRRRASVVVERTEHLLIAELRGVMLHLVVIEDGAEFIGQFPTLFPRSESIA